MDDVYFDHRSESSPDKIFDETSICLKLTHIKCWEGKSYVQILKCLIIIKKTLFNFTIKLVYIARYCCHSAPGCIPLYLHFHLVTLEALKTGFGVCALCFTCSEIYSRQYEIQVVLDAELVTDVALLKQSFSSVIADCWMPLKPLLISLLCLLAIY